MFVPGESFVRYLPGRRTAPVAPVGQEVGCCATHHPTPRVRQHTGTAQMITQEVEQAVVLRLWVAHHTGGNDLPRQAVQAPGDGRIRHPGTARTKWVAARRLQRLASLFFVIGERVGGDHPASHTAAGRQGNGLGALAVDIINKECQP